MTEHKWTLPSTSFPDQDHQAFVNLSRGAFGKVTVYGYARTWSMFLAAVSLVLRGFLRVDPVDRVTKDTVDIFVKSLMTHLRPIDVVATLRVLKTCTLHLFGEEAVCIYPAIKKVQSEALKEGNLVRPRRPPKAIKFDQLPENDKVALQQLSKAKQANGKPLSASTIKQYNSTYMLFVGALERAGLPWKSLTPRERLTKENASLIAREWSPVGEPWKVAQRLNVLACACQLLFGADTVTDILAVAADLRASNPEGNASKDLNKYLSYEEVMEEDKARLEYALKNNWGRSFLFNGKESQLKHRHSREATASKCRRTLRALTTVLKLKAPEILRQATEDRDYKAVVNLVIEHYEEESISAQIAALDGLRSLLVRILPLSKDLRHLRYKISKLKRRLVTEDLVVHDVQPDETLRFAIDVMEQSYSRYVDLKVCQEPYCSPMEYALRFRTALQVGFLAHNPLRLRSLRLLDTGEVVKKELGCEVRYFVKVPKEKMKMKIKHDYLLPVELTLWVDRYMSEIRKEFFTPPDINDSPAKTVDQKASEEKALWISKKEERMSATALSLAIPALMKEMCGFWVNIQLFRRFVATAEIGTNNGSKRLGHRSRMSRKAYEDAKKAQNVDRRTILWNIYDEL